MNKKWKIAFFCLLQAEERNFFTSYSQNLGSILLPFPVKPSQCSKVFVAKQDWLIDFTLVIRIPYLKSFECSRWRPHQALHGACPVSRPTCYTGRGVLFNTDLGSFPGWWTVIVATNLSGWWNITNLCQYNVLLTGHLSTQLFTLPSRKQSKPCVVNCKAKSRCPRTADDDDAKAAELANVRRSVLLPAFHATLQNSASLSEWTHHHHPQLDTPGRRRGSVKSFLRVPLLYTLQLPCWQSKQGKLSIKCSTKIYKMSVDEINMVLKQGSISTNIHLLHKDCL